MIVLCKLTKNSQNRSEGTAVDPILVKHIELLRAGDESSFQVLREQYAALLLSMTSGALAECPEAEYEDLMQEATLALYHAAMTFDLQQTEVTFGLYAKICIRNRLISSLRKFRRSVRTDHGIDDHSRLTPTQRKSARRASLGDLTDLVDTLFSEYEKSVYQLYLQGYTAAEIASHTGRTLKSVDNAIYRIRRKIKLNLPNRDDSK